MVPPLPVFSSPIGGSLKARPLAIDARNHLAQRGAVREAVQRLFITGRRFRQGEVTTRVLIAGQVYEVDTPRLDQLRSGLTPGDLFLEPLADEDE